MDALAEVVGTILIDRFVITVFLDNIIPRVMTFWRYKKETKGVADSRLSEFTKFELEFILDPFALSREIIGRYMDQVHMFGYMVLFVCAFPVAPFLGYFSNILQIHQFGYTLLFRKQRNFPVGAQDIGSFQDCFQKVAFLSIPSNMGLIFFTMREFYFPPDFPTEYVVWLFFGTQALLLTLVNAIGGAMLSIPESVDLQLRRREFIEAEIFKGLSSEGQERQDSPIRNRHGGKKRDQVYSLASISRSYSHGSKFALSLP